MRTFREQEILIYWRSCREVRTGDDPASGYNDLHAIALHSDWPQLRRKCAEMLVDPADKAMRL